MNNGIATKTSVLRACTNFVINLLQVSNFLILREKNPHFHWIRIHMSFEYQNDFNYAIHNWYLYLCIVCRYLIDNVGKAFAFWFEYDLYPRYALANRLPSFEFFVQGS